MSRRPTAVGTVLIGLALCVLPLTGCQGYRYVGPLAGGLMATPQPQDRSPVHEQVRAGQRAQNNAAAAAAMNLVLLPLAIVAGAQPAPPHPE